MMTEQLSLKNISMPIDAIFDVVFIHGLNGHPTTTWTCPKTRRYWPDMLSQNVTGVAVHVFGYISSLVFKHDGMDSNEKVISFLNFLKSNSIGERPFIIICHSLGGVFAKMILRKSIDEYSSNNDTFHENCKHIIFIAVPHSGKKILRLIPRSFKNSFAELLSNSNGYIDDLNQQFNFYVNSTDDLDVTVYYGKKDEYIDCDEAKQVFYKKTAVAINGDHKSICKPSNENEVIHKNIIIAIKLLHNKLSTSNSDEKLNIPYDDFSKISPIDGRRSLKEKLKAAGRIKDYPLAIREKSIFFSQFQRDGLSETAKKEYSMILSSVQQQFETHIRELINIDCNHPDINARLQEFVYNAVEKKFEHVDGITSKTIQRAVYYLTGQCHIRWDPEK